MSILFAAIVCVLVSGVACKANVTLTQISNVSLLYNSILSASDDDGPAVNLNLLNLANELIIYNRCPSAERERMARCEDAARQEWFVRDVDFYTETRKFCCFVWDTLQCQIDIALYCDPQYASDLSDLTDSAYGAMCRDYGRRSAICLLRWWSLLLVVLGVILILVLIICLMCCLVFKRRRQQKVTENRQTLAKQTTW